VFLFRGGKGDGFVCIVYDSLKSGHPIMPRMTSNPCDVFQIPGLGLYNQHILFLTTNALEMNECDAPVSKRTSVENLLSRNIP
jgi:hypothetical protein